jgi:hypothetical protein
MKIRIPRISLVVVTTLIFGSLTPAQQIKLQAQVPFDFVLGNTLYPAGHYTVTTEISNNVLRIEGDHAMAVLTLSIPVVSSVPSREAKLVFHHIRGSFFLYQVWGEKSEAGREFLSSQTEIQMARKGTKAVAIAVAAALVP